MTVLYKVAREQLSKQSHYDWGLRALTAVLRMAGKLRRESPGLSEIMVLMRALRYALLIGSLSPTLRAILGAKHRSVNV